MISQQKLLMWEIGRNLKDSEKEFDRTCVYIVDTINALKELDRRSRRFELEQDTLGQIHRVPLGIQFKPEWSIYFKNGGI